ncbi:hypothetical protein GCM10010344_15860 [Streptomyces bluensis]|nr:hypothetical protein GCM10010344_15860 [Streptomyces bluensis]
MDDFQQRGREGECSRPAGSEEGSLRPGSEPGVVADSEPALGQGSGRAGVEDLFPIWMPKGTPAPGYRRLREDAWA